MTRLIHQRCGHLKINNQIYPGFIDFQGSYDGLSQSGLIKFSGTVTLIDSPDNPKSLDRRKSANYSNFCFGQVVEIWIEDDSGIIKRPRCIPKLFLKSLSPFDPVSLQSTISVVDVLGIAEDYTTDHWINPIQNDGDEENIEYWWDVWNKPGEVSNDEIVGTLLSRLNIPYSGGISGKLRTPWTLSGGLIQAAGKLAFNSDIPGVLYADAEGNVKFYHIETRPPLKLEIFCDPVEFNRTNGVEPIDQLIVTAVEPVIEEPDPEIEELAESDERCTIDREFAPEYTFNPTASGIGINNETLIATERTCTKILRNTKIITTTRDERRGIVFPDIDPSSPFIASPGDRADFIRSLEKTVTQEFEEVGGEMIRETTIIKKPWGLIFNNWYDNHQNWNCNGGIYPSIATPSQFPDEAKYHDALHVYQETIKTWIYNDKKKVKEVKITTQQPVLSILTDYNGTASQGTYLNFRDYAIASQTIERWTKSGKDELHTKIERRPAQSVKSDALRNRENYLYNLYVSGNDTVNLVVDIFTRFTPPQTGYENGTELINVNFVSDKERLALISTQSISEASRTGAANAPATEYLPLKDDDNKFNNENWIDKPLNYRLDWNFSCSDSQYKPPRELLNLEKVSNKAQMKAIADIIFMLRQGESQTYDLTVELDNFWINNWTSPFFRVDIKDCCHNVWTSHLGHEFAIGVNRTKAIVQMGLLWLGSRDVSSDIDLDTGYAVDFDGRPLYPETGGIADTITGFPLNSSGLPYYPPLNLIIDPVSGFPFNGVESIDPATGLPIDPVSGFPTNGTYLIDPATNLPIDPQSGYPFDGTNLIDPETGWALDSEYRVIDPVTNSPIGRIAPKPSQPSRPQPKNPNVNFTFKAKLPLRWKMSKIDRLSLTKSELYNSQSGLSF